MSMDPGSWITLRSADLSAAIDPLGAQLSVLRDAAQRDLLWNGDPAVWAGRAPILFPIVGMLAGGHYRSGGKLYALPRHGFARNRSFTVTAATAQRAVFTLKADAATLEVYPFVFELEVAFALEGPTLSISGQVRNPGEAVLPASLGYHPALRWPLPYGAPRAAHFIEFDADEPAPIRRIDANGLLRPEPQPTPVRQRRLWLADELFREDALIFDQLRSRRLTYGSDTAPRIGIEFAAVPYLGIWSKPGAGFVCIEPWHGITDAEGYAGDIRNRPGTFLVPAGGAVTVSMHVTLSHFAGG